MMEHEWGLQSRTAPFKFNFRGVVILFNYSKNTMEINIHTSLDDEIGHYIITDISVDGIKVTLTNLNGDVHSFQVNIFKKTDRYENESISFCGDWNGVLNPSADFEKKQKHKQCKKYCIRKDRTF